MIKIVLALHDIIPKNVCTFACVFRDRKIFPRVFKSSPGEAIDLNSRRANKLFGLMFSSGALVKSALLKAPIPRGHFVHL